VLEPSALFRSAGLRAGSFGLGLSWMWANGQKNDAPVSCLVRACKLGEAREFARAKSLSGCGCRYKLFGIS